MEATESRVLACAASFSQEQWAGLEVGSVFVNPLHQQLEGRSEVLFVPTQAPCTMLICMEENVRASFQAGEVLHSVLQRM